MAAGEFISRFSNALCKVPMISMEHMNLVQRKKKKDFKIRENLVIEFERLAPSGKQTTIIENLIAGWIAEQRREVTKSQIRKAYERRAKR